MMLVFLFGLGLYWVALVALFFFHAKETSPSVMQASETYSVTPDRNENEGVKIDDKTVPQTSPIEEILRCSDSVDSLREIDTACSKAKTSGKEKLLSGILKKTS
jgi:hypothetical protein